MDAHALQQIRTAAAGLVAAIDLALGESVPTAHVSSKNLMTTNELASSLNRATETIVRWRREKKGPPYIRMQGRVLYDRVAVEKWLKEST